MRSRPPPDPPRHEPGPAGPAPLESAGGLRLCPTAARPHGALRGSLSPRLTHNSFIECSIEAGILLSGNGALLKESKSGADCEQRSSGSMLHQARRSQESDSFCALSSRVFVPGLVGVPVSPKTVLGLYNGPRQ